MKNENTPTIITARLILRKFEMSDLEALFKILKDKDVNRFLPWFAKETIEEASEFMKITFLDTYLEPCGYRYAICLKDDNVPIGYCGMNGENNDIGYGLLKEFWNEGIITEAAFALAEKIKNAGYGFITATHDIKNPYSGAVMKKIGMSYKYTYIEQWQPKNIEVTFRMYQLNFDGGDNVCMEYWDKYDRHYIEDNI